MVALRELISCLASEIVLMGKCFSIYSIAKWNIRPEEYEEHYSRSESIVNTSKYKSINSEC